MYCNFDIGSLCDFTQERTGDDFDWTVHRGPTRSSGTGPNTDMSVIGQLFDLIITVALSHFGRFPFGGDSACHKGSKIVL